MHAKDLKELKPDKSLFYMDGDDVFWHDVTVEYFKSLLDPAFLDFNFKTVTVSVDELVEAANAVPLMSDLLVVYVRTLSANAKDGDKLVLKNCLEKLPEGVAILFENDELLDAQDKKRMTKIECKRLSEQECVPFVMQLASSLDCTITHFHASSLISFNNCDLARIKNELTKLRDYAGREIKDGDLLRVAIPDTEHQLYEFTGAIAGKNKSFALTLLDDMKRRGERGAGILAMLSNQYRRMLHLSLSQGSDEELMTALGMKSAYAVQKTRQIASKYTKLQLKNIVELLNELEYRFKSGELSNDSSALDIAVSELIGL